MQEQRILQLQQGINRWISPVIALFITGLLFYLMPCLIKRGPMIEGIRKRINYVDVIRIREKKEKQVSPKKEVIKKSKKSNLFKTKAIYISPGIKFSKDMDIPFKMNLRLPAISKDIPVEPASQIRPNLLGIKGAFTIGEVDSPPIPVVRIPPIYPISARMKGIEGWVIVRFIVDEAGRVSHIRILESKPEGIFDDSVIRCVSNWRFKPAVFEGIKVKTLVQTKIRFKLR